MRDRWEAPDTRFFFVEPGRRLKVLRRPHPFTSAGAMERRGQRGILRNSPRGSLRVCGSLNKWMQGLGEEPAFVDQSERGPLGGAPPPARNSFKIRESEAPQQRGAESRN